MFCEQRGDRSTQIYLDLGSTDSSRHHLEAKLTSETQLIIIVVVICVCVYVCERERERERERYY